MLFSKMKQSLQIFLMLPWFILAVPVVLVLRLIEPWLLVRWGGLDSSRIGHLALNTERYLCEQDAGINVPKQRHVDILYFTYRPICNQQLAIMWKRVLRVWPSWILSPIKGVNLLIPGGGSHEIGDNIIGGLDVYNLLDRFPPHLEFTPEEEVRGQVGLREIGIPPDTPFVCLMVRDSAYLAQHIPGRDWGYHNYRDSDIQKYVLAAEELADRGYFVIRMGAKVREAMKSAQPRIIDYAANGMRSDFMDIYLGAKCEFCISTGMGLDEIPEVFRRPIVYVNMVSLGNLHTFRVRKPKIAHSSSIVKLSITNRPQFIMLTKKHIFKDEGRSLTMREIFNHGVGFCTLTSDYASKGIELIENTPEEIRDVVIEMVERLNGTWQTQEDDEALQRRFWEIFPTDVMDDYQGHLHGEISACFGAHFLRNNRDWLK